MPLPTRHWTKSEWMKFETYAIPSAIPLIAKGEPSAVLPPPLRSTQALVLDPLTTADDEWRDLLAVIRRMLPEPADERLPVMHHFPHDPNLWFIGREAAMTSLHEALHLGPAPYDSGKTLAWALVWLGGVGKTTLANEYARRFLRLYPQIFSVDAR